MDWQCIPPLPPKPTIAAPPWADPIAMMGQTAFKFSTAALSGAGPTRIAKPDPMRVAIGFGPGSVALGVFSVAPQPRPDLYGFVSSSAMPWFWFHLLEHGVMVNQEWWANSAGATTIGLYEIYRLF